MGLYYWINLKRLLEIGNTLKIIVELQEENNLGFGSNWVKSSSGLHIKLEIPEMGLRKEMKQGSSSESVHPHFYPLKLRDLAFMESLASLAVSVSFVRMKLQVDVPKESSESI